MLWVVVCIIMYCAGFHGAYIPLQVTTSGLVSLSQGVCSKVLKELNVSHCLNVTDEGILAITANCPKLSILVFHACPLLTETAREATSALPLKQVTWTIY